MEEKENAFELVESRKALDLVPTWEVQAWWFIASGLALLILAVILFVLRRKKVFIDPHREKRDAYAAAKERLETMEQTGSRETAIIISLALRGYLACSMDDPALYETHEEFNGRHEGLKDLPEHIRLETSGFFNNLASIKYAPEDMPIEGNIRERALALLERIYKA